MGQGRDPRKREISESHCSQSVSESIPEIPINLLINNHGFAYLFPPIQKAVFTEFLYSISISTISAICLKALEEYRLEFMVGVK